MNQLALFAEPAAGTQNRAILDALRAGQALTPLEALDRYGCFRLAARVHDLRRQGWPIIEKDITTPTGKRVASYSLHAANGVAPLSCCNTTSGPNNTFAEVIDGKDKNDQA